MPHSKTKDRSRRARVSELDVIEDRMGRLASLFSDVADALSDYPEALHLQSAGSRPTRAEGDTITVRAAEWPSFEEVQALMTRWRLERARAERVPTGRVVHKQVERA